MPVGIAAAAAGAGAAFGASGATGAAAGFTAPGCTPSTSARTIRPCGPEPVTAARSRPFSLAIRRARGEAKTRAPPDTGAAAAATRATSAATAYSAQLSARYRNFLVPLLTLGAGTPSWLLQAGLLTDEAGQLVLNERLQSESHRQVFVVPGHAPAEVGPVLEANLRTAITGGTLRKAPLDLSRLKVVACGNAHAIAAWGPLSLEGREVWHWKDRRDRRQLSALLTP